MPSTAAKGRIVWHSELPRRRRIRKRPATLALIGSGLLSSLLHKVSVSVSSSGATCFAFSARRASLRHPVHNKRSSLSSAIRDESRYITGLLCKSETDIKSMTNAGSIRIAEIRSVDWCGYRGMLPLQRYRGSMHNFDGWLRRPLGGAETKRTSGEQPDLNSMYKLTIQQKELRRQQRKAEAQRRASQPLDPSKHLRPIYIDDHIVVVSKASGALSVPGPRRNPSLANLCYTYFGNESDDVDKMAVHRLDLDTSGVVVYARSDLALRNLNEAFRDRKVKKKYQALLCGHMAVLEGEINMPLKRDRRSPPFMRVDTGKDDDDNTIEQEKVEGEDINKHGGFDKMMNKAPKPSLTLFHVISFEHLDGLPVTRVELTPITGRTHQLRVHCASIGHPIIGDDIYGIGGEGTPNGGIPDTVMDSTFPDRASLELQKDINTIIQQRRKTTAGGKTDNSVITGGPGNLCLHARCLALLHPLTNAPLVFEADPPF